MLVASDIMVEPLCGGMGSEGGGRSSEGGAGWEDRWREAAGRIAVGGGWESALLSFNDFLFVHSMCVLEEQYVFVSWLKPVLRCWGSVTPNFSKC